MTHQFLFRVTHTLKYSHTARLLPLLTVAPP